MATARVTLETLQKAPRAAQGEEEDEEAPPKGAGKKPPPGPAQEAQGTPGDGPDGQDDPEPPEGKDAEDVVGEVMQPGLQTPTQQTPVTAMAKPRSIPELEEALSDPKSLFWDPFAIVDALGYKDRPSPLSYQTLQSMVWRMPVVQAIIQTRIKQVANFARVQQDRYTVGFRVAQRDAKASASKGTEQRSQQLERWLLTTGVTDNPAGRDSFSAFLQKIVRDTLTYDQMTWEVVPARSGKPAEFYAVDASTIRIADTTKLFVDPEDKDVVRYVQIYDGLVVSEYSSQEMCFAVRNPATNIRLQQYGQSELEMLITTITSLLWAFDYNMKAFSQGTSVKGIINFKGAVPEKQLRAFRRQWYSMTAGVENAFKTPIVNSDDLQWVNMQMSNRDMEYNAYVDFQIKLACAVYGIDPMEINFRYGDSGGAKSMFESGNANKLAASKDKGLKPLLEFLEHHINQSLIWPLDEDFTFEFVGLEADSKSDEADLITKQIKTFKKVNEIRAEEGLPPDPNGDIILDPTYLQHLQMQQAQQQQDEMAAQGLMPDGTPMGQDPTAEGGDGEDGPPGDDGEDGPPKGGSPFGKPPAAKAGITDGKVGVSAAPKPPKPTEKSMEARRLDPLSAAVVRTLTRTPEGRRELAALRKSMGEEDRKLIIEVEV
jgi:HK97 family phage portal protein